MLVENTVVTIQPISLEVNNLTLYQDEKLLILEIKGNDVIFQREKDKKIYTIDKISLKYAIEL